MKTKLNTLPQDKKIENKEVYEKELEKYQRRLLALQQLLFKEKIGLILVFEGVDAAGKGGAIKRMTEKMDPRGVLVHPISAPEPHELRYHYLQRFWRKLPKHGQVAVFDRSWYGRVLVERVERLAEEKEWQRAYDEIRAFEQTLTDGRYIMVKFWIQISKDEQLKRFEERQADPLKQWKITDEDWRNRNKWDLYTEAAETMLEKTDATHAPWHVIEGNDKKWARVAVARHVTEHIERILQERSFALPDYKLLGAE